MSYHPCLFCLLLQFVLCVCVPVLLCLWFVLPLSVPSSPFRRRLFHSALLRILRVFRMFIYLIRWVDLYDVLKCMTFQFFFANDVSRSKYLF